MTKNEFKNISVRPITYRRFRVLVAKEGGDNTALMGKLLDEYERSAALSKRTDGPKWDEEYHGEGVA